jgi:hypothetical protein
MGPNYWDNWPMVWRATYRPVLKWCTLKVIEPLGGRLARKSSICFQRLPVGVANLVICTCLLADAEDVIKRPPTPGAFRRA